VDIDEDIAMDQRGEPTDASLVAAVKEAFKAARS
jgi:hypothetical protein